MSPSMQDAMIGNRGHLESDIGFEQISRAVTLLLLDGLNDAIEVQDMRWREADSAFQQLTGSRVGQIEVPKLPPANFHDGPRRQMVQQPASAFPNVSVMTYQTVPAASQFDQFASSSITLFVESMQISGPVRDGFEVDHEEIVHRRIQRQTEAVKTVIEGAPTLLGTVQELRTPPRGGVGNASWLQRGDKGAGDRFIWHGSRLQYTVTRHHQATF